MSFDPRTISISNLAGNYPSQTSISLLNGVLTVTSDGDPYPAQAGSNMINDGIPLEFSVVILIQFPIKKQHSDLLTEEVVIQAIRKTQV